MAVAGSLLFLGLAIWLIIHFTDEGSLASSDSKLEPKNRLEITKKSKRIRPESNPYKHSISDVTRRTSWLSGAGKIPELSNEQLENYLKQNKRSALALLVASRVRKDLEFLREAVRNEPNNKVVQLELAIRSTVREEKLAGLERFRQMDPNNSYGDYLAALIGYQQGRKENALGDLEKAQAHILFGFPVAEVRQALEDAFISAGYTPVEAKAAALFGQPSLYHTPLNQLAGYLANSAVTVQASGDVELANQFVKIGLNLSSKAVESSSLIITDLIANTIETRILKVMPVNSNLPNSSISVAQRLAELEINRQEFSSLVSDMPDLQMKMSESGFLKYLKRIEGDGEVAVLRELRYKNSIDSK